MLKKVYNPIGKHQVIKNLKLAFIVLSITHFSNDNYTEETKIIDKEFLYHKEYINKSKPVFELNLNDDLINFLKDNQINDSLGVGYHQLNNRLSDYELNTMFSKKQVDSMVKIISNSKLTDSIINIPRNVTFSETQELNSLEELEQNRFQLSVPIINKKLNYAIIAYAKGQQYAMEGGYHIYRKIDDEWVFYKTVSPWIE